MAKYVLVTVLDLHPVLAALLMWCLGWLTCRLTHFCTGSASLQSGAWLRNLHGADHMSATGHPTYPDSIPPVNLTIIITGHLRNTFPAEATYHLEHQTAWTSQDMHFVRWFHMLLEYKVCRWVPTTCMHLDLC